MIEVNSLREISNGHCFLIVLFIYHRTWKFIFQNVTVVCPTVYNNCISPLQIILPLLKEMIAFSQRARCCRCRVCYLFVTQFYCFLTQYILPIVTQNTSSYVLPLYSTTMQTTLRHIVRNVSQRWTLCKGYSDGSL